MMKMIIVMMVMMTMMMSKDDNGYDDDKDENNDDEVEGWMWYRPIAAIITITVNIYKYDVIILSSLMV